MKHFAKKLIAFVLCFCLISAVAAPATFAGSNDNYAYTAEEAKLEKTGNILTKILDFLVNDLLLGTLARILPNLSFVKDDVSGNDDIKEYFYSGDSFFLDTKSESFSWTVGYGQRSIIPDDFGVMFKYARGSYAPWGYSTGMYPDDDGNDEDMKVRTVILDDNTGRGKVAFCSVDCIGIANADVQKIRAACADIVDEWDIISLNVTAIHSHQAIDSQGVWGDPLTTIATNLTSEMTGVTKSGVNEDYLNTIIERTKLSLQDAYADMKDGKLTYTNIELDDYFHTRTVSADCDTDMHRIMFYPADGSKSTVVASFGAHPEVTSYGAEFDSRLSADFVYYMEKLVNKAGSNFIFIQGNVGTNSCGRGKSNDGLDLADNHESAMRFGYEMGYICLGATMSEGERKTLNDDLGDKLGVAEYEGQEDYTVWYDGLDTFTETPVEAVLNIAHKQVKIEMDNSTALTLIKLGLANNNISYNKFTHCSYTTTEVGYMELGSALKVFLSPGELYSELLVGGYGLRNSDYNSLREDYGENVILFDLMNDAIGYVCPDETYCVVGYKLNPSSGELEEDSWCMVVSIGKTTASSLMSTYAALVEEMDETRE